MEKLLGIWTVSVVTGSLRQLREGAWAAKASPDSSYIAFVDAKSREIWLMAADGEDSRRLLVGEAGARFRSLEFSPDGRRLTYMKSRGADSTGHPKDRTAGSDVTVIEALDLKDGRTTTVFSDRGLTGFCLTRDGRMIYDRAEPPPNQAHRNFWGIMTDLETGKAIGSSRRLTNWAGFERFHNFNLSANGKRLGFTTIQWENDVYLADLKRKGIGLQSTRRLTLDERRDLLPSWTGDGQSVYFSSSRKGNFDVFRQGINESTALEVVTGPEDETSPQLSPDGLWLLYLAYPRMPDGSAPGSSRLMRMPVEGGFRQIVFNLGEPSGPWIESIQGTPDFRCPTQSPRPCILSEADNGAIVFSAFDPAIARKQELMRLTVEPGDGIAWDVSPDGSQIAYCRNYKDYTENFRITVMELARGATREIAVKGWNACQFLAWSPDSKGWFAGSYSPQGGSMLYIAASGKVHFLQKSLHRFLSARASPNGRYLAYTETTAGGNGWMIDNLP